MKAEAGGILSSVLADLPRLPWGKRRSQWWPGLPCPALTQPPCLGRRDRPLWQGPARVAQLFSYGDSAA